MANFGQNYFTFKIHKVIILKEWSYLFDEHFYTTIFFKYNLLYSWIKSIFDIINLISLKFTQFVHNFFSFRFKQKKTKTKKLVEKLNDSFKV